MLPVSVANVAMQDPFMALFELDEGRQSIEQMDSIIYIYIHRPHIVQESTFICCHKSAQ